MFANYWNHVRDEYTFVVTSSENDKATDNYREVPETDVSAM